MSAGAWLPIPPGVPPSEARLRAHLVLLLRSALLAADPRRLVQSAMQREEILPGPWNLLAVGKAAEAMAVGAILHLGTDELRRGWVLSPESTTPLAGAAPPVELPAPVRHWRGGHPLPTPAGLKSAAVVIDELAALPAGERLVVLLSGGASSLLALAEPPLSEEDYREAIQVLLGSGIGIMEFNLLRGAIDGVKGGKLARICRARPVELLLLSDVPNGGAEVIGSGPFSPSTARPEGLLHLLEAHDLTRQLPTRILQRIRAVATGEVPPSPSPSDLAFQGIRPRIVGSVADAISGAAAQAVALGYRIELLPSPRVGEARAVGAALAEMAVRSRSATHSPTPLCLLGGGETTVVVRGNGRGGRNQEVALGAVRQLAGQESILLAAFGTDGVDGPTDAAGGVAAGSSLSRLAALGLDPEAALRRNDAYSALDAIGGLIRTGPTGTNVMDLHMALITPPDEGPPLGDYPAPRHREPGGEPGSWDSV